MWSFNQYKSTLFAFASSAAVTVSCSLLVLPAPAHSARKVEVEKLFVVDCLLPGQVRRLGANMNYLTPRRPIKTTARDCEIRGGEYVEYDRADYATSLKIWLAQAKEGDPQAQTYVGEIYQKGLGLPPDYVTAAAWYQKAANQNHAPAQLNLGYLYEKGLGVEQNTIEALNWYRKASGLTDDDLQFTSTVAATVAAKDRQIEAMRQLSDEQQAQIRQLKSELTTAQQSLDNSQREYQETQQKLADVRSQLANVDTPVVVSSEDVEKLRKTLQERESELTAKQEELTTLQWRLTVTERIATDRQSELDANQENLQTQLQESQSLTNALQQQLAQTKQQLAMAQESLREKTQDKSLAAKLQNAENERQSLETEIQRHEQEARNLRNQLALVTAELEQTRNILNESKTSDAELNQRLEASEKERLRLEQALSQNHGKEDLLRAQLREVNEDINIALELARNQNAALVIQIKETESQKEQLAAQLKEQESQSETLHQGLTIIKQQYEQAKTELALRQNAVDEQRQALLEQQQKVEQLTGELEKLRGDSARRLDELAKYYESLLKEQEQKLTQQREEIEQHRRTLEQAEQQQPAVTDLAGPTIELIEPLVSVTRGSSAPVASLSSDIAERKIVGKVIAPSGLLSFTVNDKPETVAANGIFSSMVPVTGESTPVVLAAIDTQGQRASLDFTLRKANLASSAETTVNQDNKTSRGRIKIAGLGKYYALVIGNNNYSNFPKLKAASRDAEAVAKTLKSKYGFKTKLVIDADRYTVMSALNEMREKVTSEDNLLIYFAGHGELEESAVPRGYWLPVDAETNSNANWISNSAITEFIETIPAKHVLVVADSCYSGTLTRSGMARLAMGMTPDERAKHISVLAKRRARIVITSGGLKPVQDSVGGQHSVFAQALLDSLRKNEDIIDVWDLFNNVRSSMQTVVGELGLDQEPSYAPIQHAGHGGGMFFFVPA